MPDSSDDYQLPSWPPTPINRDLWNAVMGSIAARLTAREDLEATFEALQQTGIQASLDYIQVTVAPQIATLQTSITLAQEQLDQIILDGVSPDSNKLGGQLPAYYATANALSTGLTDAANALSQLSTDTADALADKADADDVATALADKADADDVATALAETAAAISLRAKGLFEKADPRSVAFTKTGAGTASIKAGTIVEVNGAVHQFAVDTAITMPALTAGTDYAIWIHPDGAISATASFTSAPVANARRIGGFHYAPGGNAAAQAGGDAVPAINEFSMWDLKWRPSCPDPRGMTLVAGAFWCDIYHLGVDHLINGTSKFNVTMADGSSPPRRPLMFGGNGTATYSTLTWWEAAEVMVSHGKELLSYADFAAAAYGTTENASAGTDPVSTILRQAYTSKWGVMLATGNVWVWGNEFGGGAQGAAWANNNGGRGQVYQQENALLLGGSWGVAAFSGSRASSWGDAPSISESRFGARGRCEHLTLV
jgi:hypothetical protein